MRSLDNFAHTKLAELEARHLRRVLSTTAREEGIWVTRDGRRMLSFSCNDYLNLTQHPKVKAAAVAAIEKYGAGAGASRLVTGNHPLYAELEAKLARWKETDACCVFGSGYLANIGIIPSLASREDVILVDELSHACIWAGARLAGSTVAVFDHNDVGHAEELLSAHKPRHRRALIATDGVFSMDGDLAPLQELAVLAERYDAWLMSDDAHGMGVVGQGRGSAFAGEFKVAVPLQMGTLSKAIGSYGGYLCASQPVIDLIRTRARPLIYSTGLPPASVAASIAALDIIEHDPELVRAPRERARLFTRLADLPEAQSAVVPLIIGEETAALAAQHMLEEEGFLAVAIRPPTVPAGTARLRFAFTAAHPENEIERLADVVRERIAKKSA
ncbi:MAG: 8-amino-7-oxononanoate synthase [Alphaproteobacteria bacterium]